MGKQVLDESVIGIISDNANCINKSDVYVGSKVYSVSLFSDKKNKKSGLYYAVAADKDTLLSISAVRDDLDENSAERMNSDLLKRVANSLGNGAEVSPVVSGAEDAVATKQPIMLKIKTDADFKTDTKSFKIVCSDINDWMEELAVMKTAKVSKKQAETLKSEYDKIMATNMIPHDEDQVKDYSFTMGIISMTFAIISIFFHSMCLFPVITMMTSLFSGYRSYVNKNTRALVLCVLAMIIGIIFAYIGWQDFFKTFKVGQPNNAGFIIRTFGIHR